MWQQPIIAIVVVFAAGYVIWSFLPMRRRQRLLDALAEHGLLQRLAVRHRARLATPGCGNCAAADGGSHATGPRSRPPS
ncbi:MAG: hypothetical protein ACRESY_09390 [Steroidobacteraceae bacterium]